MRRMAMRYDFEAGSFGPDDPDRNRCGLCDALMIVPITRLGHGVIAADCITIDGQNRTPGEERACEPIPAAEAFRAWVSIAGAIAEMADAPRWMREIAGRAVDAERARKAAA